jgi:hypothetical protein
LSLLTVSSAPIPPVFNIFLLHCSKTDIVAVQTGVYVSVIDSDLQLRFMKSANEAIFACASASVAALSAWQQHVIGNWGTAGVIPVQALPKGFGSPWAAFSWMGAPAGYGQPQTDFGSGFFQFAPAMKAWQQGATAWGGGNSWPTSSPGLFGSNPFTAFMSPDMMRTFWSMPRLPWSMYQMPWAAMLISNGVPASVANPAAQASAATLDAVEAANQQASRVFSAYRSDGGHASAQIMQFFATIIFAILASLVPLWHQLTA